MPGKKPMSLEKDSFIIGSSEEADLKLEGMFIGGIHAKVVKNKEGDYLILHLNPMGSTRVNGSKVEQHKLSDGDEIQIGKYSLIFKVR